jgi:hypothetical protein
MSDPLDRLRAICLAFPDATEKEAWGEPTFRVRDKLFAMYDNNHHDSGHQGVWIKARHEMQDLLVHSAPERYFVPPYMGPKGWVGARLDVPEADWHEIAGLIEEAYRATATKRQIARLDEIRATRDPV